MATAWTVQGSNPGGGEIFHTCPDRPWGPLSLLYNGYRVFPGGKERPGRDADLSPPSGAVVMNEYSYTSIPLMGRAACTEPQCLYKGALYLYLYLSCQLLTRLASKNNHDAGRTARIGKIIPQAFRPSVRHTKCPMFLKQFQIKYSTAKRAF
jgi:hypothetical protein